MARQYRCTDCGQDFTVYDDQDLSLVQCSFCASRRVHPAATEANAERKLVL